jgi:23S rRNA pseudouridine1911/1915/1917 synthase
MMVCEAGGTARRALTDFEVLERLAGFTYVRLLPKTGRTHQLRVHMRHIKHPIVADKLYGGRAILTQSYLAGTEDPRSLREKPGNATGECADALISRPALHARRLAFRHPATEKPVEFTAPLPADMENTLAALRNTVPPKML